MKTGIKLTAHKNPPRQLVLIAGEYHIVKHVNADIELINISRKKRVRDNRRINPAKISNAFTTAVENEIKHAQDHQHPIAKYDIESKRAYLEYPDGVREYVGE